MHFGFVMITLIPDEGTGKSQVAGRKYPISFYRFRELASLPYERHANPAVMNIQNRNNESRHQ